MVDMVVGRFWLRSLAFGLPTGSNLERRHWTGDSSIHIQASGTESEGTGREGTVTPAQKRRLTEDYAHMYVALRRIVAYMTPEQLRKKALKPEGADQLPALRRR